MAELTQAYLKQILNYDPETGIFTWLVSKRGVKAGTISGCTRKDGYRQIAIDRKLYLTHRLAWLYMTGKWPNPEIDHVDLDKSNNVWSNLREATRTQNSANTAGHLRRSSEYKGAYRYSSTGKWFASIRVHGKSKHIGYFNTPQEAHAAYCAEAFKVHGNFARFN